MHAYACCMKSLGAQLKKKTKNKTIHKVYIENFVPQGQEQKPDCAAAAFRAL